jgi:hypothetical protein
MIGCGISIEVASDRDGGVAFGGASLIATEPRRYPESEGMTVAEPNSMAVIADCIEKSKATIDQELISEYIEALGVLQTDNTEEDAFNMLGSAIVDAVADDLAHTEALFEVWSELEGRRKLQ